ncbi:hypothetical protein [Agrobacterium tumefaciens]
MPHVALPAMPALYQRLAANDLVLANFGFKIRDRNICTIFEAVPALRHSIALQGQSGAFSARSLLAP